MAVNVKIDFLANIDSAAKEVKKLGSAFDVLASSFIVKKIVSGFSSIIQEANEAEDATNGMRNALKLAGDFSEVAAKSFESLADEIQGVTKFDDDLILSQVAVAKQFGATNKEAEKLIRAAVDMAAATGKSLPEAVQLLGRTLDGTAGKLAETVPEIKSLSSAALLAGDAIGVVGKRFKDAAQAEAATFSGSITQLTNNFNNLIGELGQVVTKNDFVVGSIQKLTDILKRLKEDDTFRVLAITIGGVAAAIAVGVTVAAAIAAAFAAAAAAAAALGVSLVAIGASILGLGAAGGVLGFIASGSGAAANSMEGLSKRIDQAKSSLETMQKLAAKDPAGSATHVRVKQLTSEIERLENQMERLSNTQGAAATSVVRYGSAADKQTEKVKRFSEAIQKQFEELEKQARGFSGSQKEILARALKEQEDLVKAAIRNRPDIQARGNEVLKGLHEKFNKDIAKIDQEKRDLDDRKRKEERSKIESEFRTQQDKLRSIIADPIKGIFSVDAFTKPLFELSEGVKTAVAIGLGAAGLLLQGKEGAKKALAGIAEAIGQYLYNIPGFGAFFEALAAGPEQTRAMVAEFVQAIPDIMIAVLESIPALIETLVENSDELIIRFIDKLIERGPDIAFAIVKAIGPAAAAAMVKVFAAYAAGAAKVLEKYVSFIASAIEQYVAGAGQFIGKILEGAGQFIQKLIDEIGKGLGNIGGNILNPGGKGGGSVIPGVNIIPDSIPIIGGLFAKGGLVPEGFPDDSFPARLTSGEQVIDRTDNDRLSRFLDQQERGTERNLTVNLVIGEDQLARVMLNLNRRGFRTA